MECKRRIAVSAIALMLFSLIVPALAASEVNGLPGGSFSPTFNIEINKPPTNTYFIIQGAPVPGTTPQPAPGTFNLPLIANNPVVPEGQSPVLPMLDFGLWFEASSPGTFLIFFASRDDLGDVGINMNPYMLTLETDKTYGLNYNITVDRYDLNEQETAFTKVEGSIPFIVAANTEGGNSAGEILRVKAQNPIPPGELPYEPQPCIFGYTSAPGIFMPTIQTGAVFVDKITNQPGFVRKGYYDFHIEIPYPKDGDGKSVMFRSGFYKGYIIAHFKPDV